MAFHPTRFPLDVSLGAHGGPERRTEIVTLANGREERNSRWAHARRRYDAGYGVKSRADMLAVLAFFEERRGKFHSFLWRDGLDFSSHPSGGVPTPLDQQIGVGDGARTSFSLSKWYGGSFDPYFRPITKPLAGTVRIAVEGVELGETQFSVSGTTGEVSLLVPPPLGALLSAGFLFDVEVRFDTDRLDIELVSFDAAQVPHIPLIEVL